MKRSDSDTSNLFTNYTFAGLVLLSGTLILGFVTFGYFGHAIGFQDARIGVGLAGAVATIALALGIYLQGYQNNTIIRQNREEIDAAREQSLILQESQWMPIGVFYPRSKQFQFSNNQPHNPRIILEVDEDDTGWIDREAGRVNLSEKENVWTIHIGVEDFEERLEIGRSSFDGIMRLRFESTTGMPYEYEYEVSINLEAEPDENMTVHSEERKLPWKHEIHEE